MIALIDGDIIAYRCAASAEKDAVEASFSRMDVMIEQIVKTVSQEGAYEIYLSGANNWRYNIFPEYKAHRKEVAAPQHLAASKEYLRKHYAATSEETLEADDLIGIRMTELSLDGCACSLDKDFFTIPGNHYQWPIQGVTGGTAWSKEGFKGIISPLQALRYFYGQLILGDGADGVPGFDGKMRKQVPKFIIELQQQLDNFTEPEEMFEYVSSLYIDEEALIRNAKVLHIMKERGVFWEPPGQPQDTKPSS